MDNLSDRTCCVIDNGLFLPIARRMARDFGRVLYYSPCERSFPSVAQCLIGDGFPDIERITTPWDHKNEVDLFVFPDVGFGALQVELIEQGKLVWGSRKADELELSRGKFLETLMNTALPVPKYRMIRGLTALCDYLKGEEDKYVKISRFRGDMETLHYRSWAEDESTLDAIAVKLGPLKEQMPFYVFEPINTKIEDGVDSYCIDGQWPSLCVHGMEAKDKAFLGAIQKFSDLPEEVRVVNDEFGPVLAEYGYRGFFSSEVRITKEGESFFIDPTCRAGSPPSQSMTELFDNFSQIVWEGAAGNLADPIPAAQFAVQGLLSVSGDVRAWRTLTVDSYMDQWVKCGNCMRVEDRLCFPPDPMNAGSQDVGWLVGIGDTMEEAIKHLQHNTKQLPDGATCEYSALADLLKEVQEAEDKGMEFSDQEPPTPEIVVES